MAGRSAAALFDVVGLSINLFLNQSAYRDRAGEPGAQHFAHACPMRTSPINASATRATRKLGVMLVDAIGNMSSHLAFFEGFELKIAMQAQREWPHMALEAEAHSNFAQLQFGLTRVDEAAARHVPNFQQLAVAREHDAPLARRDINDLMVRHRVFVQRIKAEHAQHSRKAAEMSIRHEFWRLIRDYFDKSVGENLDRIAFAHNARESRRMIVYQQLSSFSVWHAEGFNRMLDGCGSRAYVIERNVSAVAGYEVGKFPVEPESGGRHETRSDDS